MSLWYTLKKIGLTSFCLHRKQTWMTNHDIFLNDPLCVKLSTGSLLESYSRQVRLKTIRGPEYQTRNIARYCVCYLSPFSKQPLQLRWRRSHKGIIANEEICGQAWSEIITVSIFKVHQTLFKAVKNVISSYYLCIRQSNKSRTCLLYTSPSPRD